MNNTSFVCYPTGPSPGGEGLHPAVKLPTSDVKVSVRDQKLYLYILFKESFQAALTDSTACVCHFKHQPLIALLCWHFRVYIRPHNNSARQCMRQTKPDDGIDTTIATFSRAGPTGNGG